MAEKILGIFGFFDALFGFILMLYPDAHLWAFSACLGSGIVIMAIAGYLLGRKDPVSELVAEMKADRAIKQEPTIQVAESKRDMAVIDALFWINHSSAWMRFMNAQHIINNGEEPNDQIKMWHAIFKVNEKLESGDLTARASRGGSIAYETVDKDLWKNAALNITPDKRTLWRIHLIARTGVGEEKTKQIPDYDSFFVSEERVYEIWPEEDTKFDQATINLLSRDKHE